jgi:hypothetical protein
MNKIYITVIYEITDEAEWRKTNPLTYQHHGMKSISVSVGDLLEWKEKAAKILEDNGLEPPELFI